MLHEACSPSSCYDSDVVQFSKWLRRTSDFLAICLVAGGAIVASKGGAIDSRTVQGVGLILGVVTPFIYGLVRIAGWLGSFIREQHGPHRQSWRQLARSTPIDSTPLGTLVVYVIVGFVIFMSFVFLAAVLVKDR